MFANNDPLNGRKALLYFDLSAMTSSLGVHKNFEQLDVHGLADQLTQSKPNNRNEGMHLFQCLLLARTLVMERLIEKDWPPESLLLVQLGIHRNTEVLTQSYRVFHTLVSCNIDISDDYSYLAQSYVAVDEANVALSPDLGMYESKKYPNAGNVRPFLSCIVDCVHGMPCVLSGTSYRVEDMLDSIVSNVAPLDIPRFTEMTKMDNVSKVGEMFARFEVDWTKVSAESMSSLVGRCRLVTFCITRLIMEAGQDTVSETVTRAVRELKNGFCERISDRLSQDPASAKLIQDLVVATLIGKPFLYGDVGDSMQWWADESFFSGQWLHALFGTKSLDIALTAKGNGAARYNGSCEMASC